jgi:peptidoglycan hydrolase-like protein with peptidoglycan-binding domain
MSWCLFLLLISLAATHAQYPGSSVLTSASELPLPNGPQSQCAFPRLCPACKMNAVTIRIAQRLIASALNVSSFTPDGVFTPGFAANITRFQQSYSLPTTGIMDSTTWRALAALSSIGPSSSATSIAALQDALAVLGWKIALNGVWDNDTSTAFAAFRSSRKLPPSPPSTTPADWLFLSSWCNPAAGSFWFDAGWPQGEIDILTLACLRYAGFEFATFECWRGRPGQEHLNGWWPQCLRNLVNARAAGFSKLGV